MRSMSSVASRVTVMIDWVLKVWAVMEVLTVIVVTATTFLMIRGFHLGSQPFDCEPFILCARLALLLQTWQDWTSVLLYFLYNCVTNSGLNFIDLPGLIWGRSQLWWLPDGLLVRSGEWRSAIILWCVTERAILEWLHHDKICSVNIVDVVCVSYWICGHIEP